MYQDGCGPPMDRHENSFYTQNLMNPNAQMTFQRNTRGLLGDLQGNGFGTAIRGADYNKIEFYPGHTGTMLPILSIKPTGMLDLTLPSREKYENTADVGRNEAYHNHFRDYKRSDKGKSELSGSDMDISRSRSNSPLRKQSCLKKRTSRAENDRERKRRVRSRSARDIMLPSVADDVIRQGTVWSNDNYYSFLKCWVERMDNESKTSDDRAIRGRHRLVESITKASRSEKKVIVLPPSYKDSNLDHLLHCEISIHGLPTAIFFGSGYGTHQMTSRYGSAKNIIDKCYRIGVIGTELHAAIHGHVDVNVHEKHIRQATEAILLVKKTITERFPKEIFSEKELEPSLIDKLQEIMRSVIEVYYPENRCEISSQRSLVLNTQEPVYMPSSSRIQDYSRFTPPYYGSHEPGPSNLESVTSLSAGISGLSVMELIEKKEKEMRERMEAELTARKKELEEEIRQQVINEEREKIKEQLERENMIAMMIFHQQQYQKEHELIKQEQSLGETQHGDLLMQVQKNVDEELDKMVVNLESKLLEFRQKGMTSMLDMIFESSTFKAITSLADTPNSLTVGQKEQLVIDLRTLLECASLSVAKQNSTTSEYSSCSSSISDENSGRSISDNSIDQKDKVTRFRLGDLNLRSLSASEQKNLIIGQKLIVQDKKTGRWHLATIHKINGERVSVSVNNTTWKKTIEELFIEEKQIYK